jgi:hypothetical protein
MKIHVLAHLGTSGLCNIINSMINNTWIAHRYKMPLLFFQNFDGSDNQAGIAKFKLNEIFQIEELVPNYVYFCSELSPVPYDPEILISWKNHKVNRMQTR